MHPFEVFVYLYDINQYYGVCVVCVKNSTGPLNLTVLRIVLRYSELQNKWGILEGLKMECLEVKPNYKCNFIQHVYQMEDKKFNKNCVLPSSM